MFSAWRYTENSSTSPSDSCRGLLACGAVWCCGRIPTFHTSMLPPPSDTSSWRGGSMDLRNPWYLTTTPHGATTQKTLTWIFIRISSEPNKISFFMNRYLLSSCVTNLKIKMYRPVILLLVLYGYEACSLWLREEHRFRVFGNRLLRKIFALKRKWRKAAEVQKTA
jgi:hypothetical protein